MIKGINTFVTSLNITFYIRSSTAKNNFLFITNNLLYYIKFIIQELKHTFKNTTNIILHNNYTRLSPHPATSLPPPHSLAHHCPPPPVPYLIPCFINAPPRPLPHHCPAVSPTSSPALSLPRPVPWLITAPTAPPGSSLLPPRPLPHHCLPPVPLLPVSGRLSLVITILRPCFVLVIVCDVGVFMYTLQTRTHGYI